jgi:UDP:flavonoid glycosyltransferase YjiC (YdhE family)
VLDRAVVTIRVELSSSGSRLPAKKLNPASLKAAVLQAMSITAGAQRVSDGFKVAGGVSHGADLIERRLLGLRV